MLVNQLSAQAVRTKKKPGYYCDGGGLYLQVSRYGTKSWVFRFTLNGRTRDMGLGSVETFTLKEARERARNNRQLVADGIDPIEDRERKRDEIRADTLSRMVFKDAVERFLELHEGTWKNAKHQQQWRNTLKTYAYPTLGARPISAIDGALITEALAPIWTRKPETARRVKQRIERVCQWVKDGQPLPMHGAGKRVEHHPALPYGQTPAFMVELRTKDGMSARALEFTILTAARTDDTIDAKWKEVDFDKGVWRVSDGRHKSSKEFEIPLSKEALTLLENLPRIKGNPFIFPGAKGGLSNGAMLALLKKRMKPWHDEKGRQIVPHGFRSTFRDWAGDQTAFPRDVIEAAMGHKVKDRAEAAYRRSSALEKRRKLMDAWSRYCVSPPAKGVNVTPMRGAA